MHGEHPKGAAGGDDHFSYLLPVAEDEAEDDASSSGSSQITQVVPEWGPKRNWIRTKVLLNPWFERFWLVVITANCVTLAMEDPTDKDCETSRCKFTTIADYIFTNLFVVEMVLKVIGFGLLSRHDSYLRDSWCLMDGLIVISGVIAFAMDVLFDVSGPALTGLRAFRLLRPLKAVQAFPAVRILIQSILASLPNLGDVFVLYCFFLLIMGIISVQQWKGLLSLHCVTEESHQSVLQTGNESLFVQIGSRVCHNGSYFEVGGHLCNWGEVCVRYGGNPEGGLLSFDNIGVASLTLFVALTLEGWTDSMYETMDATTYFASFFWVILVIFGSFFILNLTIVIITEAFEMKQKEQKADAFRAIDKDGGGELDKDEVRRLLTKLNGGVPPTEVELDRVFAEMDKDGGGTVSLEEFLQYAEKNAATVGAALTRGRSGAAGFGREVKNLVSNAPLIGGIKGAVEQVATGLEEAESKRSAPRDLLYQLVEPTGEDTNYPMANHVFHTSVMGAILLNTIALGIEHHGQPQEMTDVFNILNWVFTVFFALEAVIKIIGLGPVAYVSDRFNIFDFVVSALSVVGLFGVVDSVSVFRTFRALRVLRLAKQVPLLQRWIGILLSSMKGAAVLTSLLMMVVFIVALLGMQLFGGNFCHLDEGFDPTDDRLSDAERGTGRGCGGVPRSNYDDLGASLITTFQILTGEDWNKIMYNGMRAAGDWVSIYFVLYYMLGNYMMLNLFIAVLLNSREMKDSASSDTQPSENADDNEIPMSPRTLSGVATSDPASPSKDWQRLCEEVDTAANPLVMEEGSPVAGPDVVLSRKRKGYEDALEKKREREKTGGFVLPDWLQDLVDNDRSLLFFQSDHELRKRMMWLFQTTAFELLVLACILVSTATLALESPLRPEDHPTERLLHQINFVMVWVFLLECVVKVVGMGFVLHPTSYLRSEGWNVLDFCIVCVSLLSLIIPGGNSLEFIKIMRTLRPLRFINKSEGMKVVFQALIRSIKPLMNVLLISLLVWTIFGIMGVQIFSGKFYRCSLNSFGDMEEELGITKRLDCQNITMCSGPGDVPCRWMNYDSHFDHLPAAFLNLFEMASLEGWVDVMNLGIDSISHDEAPVANNNPWMSLYFLIFIVFGAFFIINMFIGVLIDTYYQEKEKASHAGGLFLNERQKLWVDHHTKMLNIMSANRKEVGVGVKDSFLLKAVNSTACDYFITGCIVLNVVMMATEHYPGEMWMDVLGIANFVFYGIFAAEAVLKLIAMGPKIYLQDAWNKFDLSIVILSTLGVIMELALQASPAVSIFRILRLARLLRMVKKAKGIKRILRTLLLSLPSMMNVAGILFLMFFVYAVLGVKLFARLKRGGEDDAMGPYANFENFGFSLLLLLRMTTGEAWQAVLKEASVAPPHDCDPHLDECGRPLIAVIYFCSFTLSGMYVLLNLFIAVILDAFSQSNEDGICTEEYIEHVRYCWAALRHDIPIEGSGGGILPTDLFSFLSAIGPPLGMRSEATPDDVEDFVKPMDLGVDRDSGLILEAELIPKLFKMKYGQSLPQDLQDALHEKERALVLASRRDTVGPNSVYSGHDNSEGSPLNITMQRMDLTKVLSQDLLVGWAEPDPAAAKGGILMAPPPVPSRRAAASVAFSDDPPQPTTTYRLIEDHETHTGAMLSPKRYPAATAQLQPASTLASLLTPTTSDEDPLGTSQLLGHHQPASANPLGAPQQQQQQQRADPPAGLLLPQPPSSSTSSASLAPPASPPAPSGPTVGQGLLQGGSIPTLLPQAAPQSSQRVSHLPHPPWRSQQGSPNVASRAPLPWAGSERRWPSADQPTREVRIVRPAGGGSLGLRIDPDWMRVTSVSPGGPAEAAGVVPGMRLRRVGGRTQRTSDAAAARIKRLVDVDGHADVEAELPDPTEMLLERHGGPDHRLDFLQLYGMCQDLGITAPSSVTAFEAVCHAKGRDPRSGFEWCDVHEMMSGLPYSGRRRVLVKLGLIPGGSGRLGNTPTALPPPHASDVVKAHWAEVPHGEDGGGGGRFGWMSDELRSPLTPGGGGGVLGGLGLAGVPLGVPDYRRAAGPRFVGLQQEGHPFLNQWNLVENSRAIGRLEQAFREVQLEQQLQNQGVVDYLSRTRAPLR